MDLSKLNSLKPSQIAGADLLQRASVDPKTSLVTLAALYRAYIKAWAGAQISPTMRQRFQSSTVAQESLMRIQGQSADFDCRSLPEFENYLLKTARAVISDLRRRHLADKRSLLRDVPLEELESQVFWDTMRKLPQETPHALAAVQDERVNRIERIRTALLEIKPHYQKVILLHFEAGQTIAEIAAALERSEKATRMLIVRALRALKAKVETGNKNVDE